MDTYLLKADNMPVVCFQALGSASALHAAHLVEAAANEETARGKRSARLAATSDAVTSVAAEMVATGNALKTGGDEELHSATELVKVRTCHLYRQFWFSPGGAGSTNFKLETNSGSRKGANRPIFGVYSEDHRVSYCQACHIPPRPVVRIHCCFLNRIQVHGECLG